MTIILVMAGVFYAYTTDAKPHAKHSRYARTARTAVAAKSTTTAKATAPEEENVAPTATASEPEPASTITTSPSKKIAVVMPAKAPRAAIPAKATAYQVDSLELNRYPYINATYDGTPQPSYSIDEFCRKAGAVIFTVNKTNIAPGNPFLNELRNEILPLIQSQHLELYRIDVRGAASPEGSVENNARLAKERANVLRDSITSILPSAKGDIIKLSSETEDYELLIHYMREANDPDTELVESIYHKWKGRPADLKWALFTAKKRTLWKRLLAEYFPMLRATRVILYFHISPDAPPPPPAVEEEKQDTIVPPPPVHKCECAGKTECQCALSGTPCPCGDSIEGFCPCITPPAPQDTIVHRRPVWAISTNLIYDLWYMPDYGFAPMWNGKLEYYPHSDKHNFWNHTSFCAGFINPYWHSWKRHKFYQIRNYELEARLYRRYDNATEQRYGWYIGAAADVNKYGIGLSDLRGWQGEGFGFQVTGGYVLPLNKCKSWKLEFNLGAGFYQTKYDPYIYEDPYAGSSGGHAEYDPPTYDPGNDQLHYYYKWYGAASDFKKRQYRFRWLGPTQIGISIKYDFLWKRQQRRGVSFHHTETIPASTPVGYQRHACGTQCNNAGTSCGTTGTCSGTAGTCGGSFEHCETRKEVQHE